MKKNKQPPNVPKLLDFVKLKGRDSGPGLLIQVNSNNWCTIEWDSLGSPRICHLFELEKVDGNILHSTKGIQKEDSK